MDDELRERLDALEKKVDVVSASVEKIRTHFRREFVWKAVSIFVPVAAIGGIAWWFRDFVTGVKDSIGFGLFG